MEYLSTRGPLAFLLGKYVLTAMGLPLIVVYKNYPMFGTRFRVGFLLPVFIGLYLVLIIVSIDALPGRVASTRRRSPGPMTAVTALPEPAS